MREVSLDIDQDLILTKFIQYLRLQKQKPLQYDTTTLDNLIKELNPTKGGYCHGFSVIYAALHHQGKAQWWKDLLEKISAWDEKTETLEKECILIDQNDPSNSKKLWELFEFAINHIIFHHAPAVMREKGHWLGQTDLFKEGADVFSALGTNNGQENVTSRKMFAGKMEFSLFEELFQVVSSMNYLIMVHGNSHCICVTTKVTNHEAICYDLYDPNNKRGAVHASTTKELYDKIIQSLGPAIAIELVSLSKPIPTALDCIYKKHLSLDMMDENGITLIAKYAPKSLPDLIAMAQESGQQRALLEALNKQKNNGWTGWMFVARYAAESLPELIAMEQDSGQQLALLEALNKQNNNGWTGWMFVAQYAAKSLPDLIDMAKKSGQQRAVLEALNKQGNNGWTGWMIVAQYAAKSLPELVAMAQGLGQQQAVVEELNKQNNEGWTGWMFVVRYAAEYLPDLIAMAQESGQQPALLEALNKQNDEGWTGWMLVARCAAEYLPDLIAMAQGPGQKRTVVEALNKQNNEGRTGWWLVARCAAEYLPELIAMAPESIAMAKELGQQPAVSTEMRNYYSGNSWFSWKIMSIFGPPDNPKALSSIFSTLGTRAANNPNGASHKTLVCLVLNHSRTP